MRRVPVAYSHLLLPRSRLPSAAAAAAAATATSAAADRRLVPAELYSTATSPRRNRWFSPPVSAPLASSSRSVSLGLAGALSFSLTLATAAEAKEPLSPELIPKDVVLYQYETCPFCNKVKALLDYHDIPYKVVEVHPFSKKEIKWSNYKKVPILVVDGEQMVESSDIIDRLGRMIHPDNCIIDEEETKWRRWVDDHLVHVLAPNIYRTTSEALESFDYITSHGNFSRTERFTVKYAGAAAMYMVSKKLKKKYNITDERAALYDAAETWAKALEGKDFLGGSKPNLADLAVFGVLRPIRNLKSGRDMVEQTHIGEWYQRMETAVGESAQIKAGNADE